MKDGEGKFSSALNYYCQALDYFIPALDCERLCVCVCVCVCVIACSFILTDEEGAIKEQLKHMVGQFVYCKDVCLSLLCGNARWSSMLRELKR